MHADSTILRVQVVGGETTVDRDTWSLIPPLRWRVVRRRAKSYVAADRRRPETGVCYLHRLIVTAKRGDVVQHINGDVYHMQVEEEHIGAAILAARDQLINLHMADSNRRALGLGSMDLDTIIRALYVIGFNTEGRYVTPEPLGPGGDPYPAMYGKPDKAALDEMVMQTARTCFMSVRPCNTFIIPSIFSVCMPPETAEVKILTTRARSWMSFLVASSANINSCKPKRPL